jgi:hypothetical protein
LITNAFWACRRLTVIVTEDEVRTNNGTGIIVLIKRMRRPHPENP